MLQTDQTDCEICFYRIEADLDSKARLIEHPPNPRRSTLESYSTFYSQTADS